mmetsp:Transcript_26555/g.37411  ORF Transcript_26555/g.37411 Transcript_26555/m.37411 type:complete len:859 (-) Transcript_26555:119-2695(-)
MAASAATMAVSAKDAVDMMDGDFNRHDDSDKVNNGEEPPLQPEKEHDDDFDAFASARSLEMKDEPSEGDIHQLPATPRSPRKVLNEKKVATKAGVTPSLPEFEKESNVDKKENDTNTDSTAVDSSNKEEETTKDENDSSQEQQPKERFVTPKDFELLKVIGIGSFGKVLQVRNKKSQKIAAMKVISKRLLKKKVSYVENVQAEKDILTKVRHPFVVTMHCSFQTKEKLFIIMDFLAGGELFLRLGREGIFLEKTAAFYLGEITLALEHLHAHGILHRDLKPENILLGADGHACLTDFGLAKDFSDSMEGGGFGDEDNKARTVCGTQEYMAPEMVARKGYGRAADFWSMGCIAYEMMSGKPPFESRKGAKDLFRKIMQERVRMPDGASASACKLLKGLLNRNVQARWGAAKSTMFDVGGVAGLKQCDFFKGLDWEKLEMKEIDPPLTFDVDGDDDLRHFHDEFLQMPLPRSVTEMSNDNFEPRRCASDAFRGFSFVQHDFELPERRLSEEHTYWNKIEEDGESASECASSKMDFDGDDDQQALADPPLETVAEKKKRPPRKRKKKKKAADGETKEGGGDKTPVPSENGDATPLEKEEEPPKTEKKSDETDVDKPIVEKTVTEKETLTEKITEGSASSKPLDPNKQGNTVGKAAAQAPPPPPPRLAGFGGPTSNVNANKAKVQPPKQDTWAQVGGGNKQKKTPTSTLQAKPLVNSTSQQFQRPAPQPGPNSLRASAPTFQPPSLVQQQNTYSPAAGSWAAKTQSTRAAAAGTTAVPQARQQQHFGGTGASSDWRNHRMNASPRNTTGRNVYQMPKAPSMDSRSFPTLGGPSSSSRQAQATQATTTAGRGWGAKPQGAWKR